MKERDYKSTQLKRSDFELYNNCMNFTAIFGNAIFTIILYPNVNITYFMDITWWQTIKLPKIMDIASDLSDRIHLTLLIYLFLKLMRTLIPSLPLCFRKYKHFWRQPSRDHFFSKNRSALWTEHSLLCHSHRVNKVRCVTTVVASLSIDKTDNFSGSNRKASLVFPFRALPRLLILSYHTHPALSFSRVSFTHTYGYTYIYA